MEPQAWIVIGLSMVAAGCVAHVFFYPHLSGEIKAEKRQAQLRQPALKRDTDRLADAANRRKQIAETIKELGEHGKKRKHSLQTRIAQAGLAWSPKKYFTVSFASAAILGVLVWLAGAHPAVALAAMGVGGFGIPAWMLSFLRKRRLKKFVNEFPDAIDIIIRGVKAGLPLGDCLR
ncbi:MAG: pilus assembly protein, partial [Beijerinckiaceae bacterium]|nr:pilus assembly protein [Beijerinckiaceae bacterium]